MENTRATRHRAKEQFPAFYLTLISIICTLALTDLLASADVERLLRLDLAYTLKTIATGCMVVLVWNEYVMGPIFYKWVIGYTDSLIPFLYAVVFHWVTRSLGRSVIEWQACFAAYALVSLLAYWNQQRKVTREHPDGTEFKSGHNVVFRMSDFHEIVMRYCLFSCLTAMLLAAVAASARSALTDSIAMAISNVLLAGFVWRTRKLRNPVLNCETEQARTATTGESY